MSHKFMSLGIEGPNVCEIKVQFEIRQMIETLNCKQNEVWDIFEKIPTIR